MQFVLHHAPQDPRGLEAEWIFQLLRTRILKIHAGWGPTNMILWKTKKVRVGRAMGRLGFLGVDVC